MASVSTQRRPSANQAMQTFIPQSSFISLMEYDQQNLTMTTHLKSGAIYQHKFCTPLDWEGLKTAQNHGNHWASQIKGKKASVRVKSAKSPRPKNRRSHG